MIFANPRGLPNNAALRSYEHFPPNVTLHATLDASLALATPQSITLSSSSGLTQCADIIVTITGTGGLGVGTASWSLNGSAPVSFTLQASVALVGTPFSLGFPVATYTATDVYRSVVSQFTDRNGNTWVGESASALVLPFIDLVNGMPTIRTSGVRRLWTSTSTLSASLINGVRTPFSLFWTGRFNGSLVDPVNVMPLVSISNGSSGQAIFYFAVFNGNWISGKRGDSGGTTIVTGSAADNAFHTFQLIHSGTSIQVLVDGVSVMNAAQNVAASLTTILVTIGSSITTGAPPTSLYANMNWGDHAFYAGAIAADPAGYIRQNFKNLWNTP